MADLSQARPPVATKRMARLAGAVYVLLSISTIFGFYHAPLVQRDVGALGHELTKSGLRFRIGVMTDVLSAVLCVPLAVLLYELFRPVHKVYSALMSILLVLAMPISFVVALNYVAANWLLSGDPMVAALTSAQREALGTLFLHLHVHGVLAVEIFWGLWLVPFGLLVVRSQFLPRILGILLIIAGAAYVAHSITSILLPGQRFLFYERITMLARAAGELPTMLWLLIKGADSRQTALEAS